MYGMVNRAIEECIKTHYGVPEWDTIKKHSDINVTEFQNMTQYPDTDSVALLVSASAVLKKDITFILEEIGEFWIEFALKSEYGMILRSVSASGSFPHLLESLDRLHVRVGKSFSDLQPPSFWCSDIEEDKLTLHYSSKRDGLSHFVIGLINGLGKMMKFDVAATQIAFKGKEAAEHDQFLIRFKKQGSQ